MFGPTPTPAPKNEGEYARKLALAILSTLENKGLLTRLDVDTILQVAHRTASQSAESAALTANGPAASLAAGMGRGLTPTPSSAPAALGTRWVKPGTQSAQVPSEPAARLAPPTSEVISSSEVINSSAPDEKTGLDSETQVRIISQATSSEKTPDAPAPAAQQGHKPLVLDFNLE